MKMIMNVLIGRSACVFVLALAIVFFFNAPPLFANLYKWEGPNGVLHITDDLGKVPEALRHNVEVFPIKPHLKKNMGEAPVHIPPTQLKREKPPELYGGQTLQWWKDAFDKIGEDMDTLKDEMRVKRQFISVFEGGRRFGQTYGDVEVSLYKRYKKEIIKDRESLNDLEDELKELRRKATNNAVPRSIRGE